MKGIIRFLFILSLASVVSPLSAQGLSPDDSPEARAASALALARRNGHTITVSTATLAAAIRGFENARFVTLPAPPSGHMASASSRRYACTSKASALLIGTIELTHWARAHVRDGLITRVVKTGFSYGHYGHVIPSLDWTGTGTADAWAEDGGRRIRLTFDGQGKMWFAGFPVGTFPIHSSCVQNA